MLNQVTRYIEPIVFPSGLKCVNTFNNDCDHKHNKLDRIYLQNILIILQHFMRTDRLELDNCWS